VSQSLCHTRSPFASKKRHTFKPQNLTGGRSTTHPSPFARKKLHTSCTSTQCSPFARKSYLLLYFSTSILLYFSYPQGSIGSCCVNIYHAFQNLLSTFLSTLQCFLLCIPSQISLNRFLSFPRNTYGVFKKLY
jgi:hypothetical protein